MNLANLEKYREELVAEHNEELAAIDRLIARERAKESAGGAPPQPARNGTTDRPAPRPIHKGMFEPKVSPEIDKALKRIGNGPFTREDVSALLHQMDISMEGWGPRAVGVNLWRRAQAGELTVVRLGLGGKSAVYRKA